MAEPISDVLLDRWEQELSTDMGTLTVHDQLRLVAEVKRLRDGGDPTYPHGFGRCPVCGAEPGEPCTFMREGTYTRTFTREVKATDARERPHFYREPRKRGSTP
jgi:hypothetical protein